MLVPYYAFELGSAGDEAMVLDHVYFSPTSNIGGCRT